MPKLSGSINQRDFVLTPQEARFVEEFLIDLDAREAAARAQLKPSAGAALLKLDRIQRAVALARGRRSSRTAIYSDEVLRRWATLVRADPNELVQLRVGACRYCHGIDHQYQFTLNELRQARQAYQLRQLELPASQRRTMDERGGDGYDANRPPCSVENGDDHNCPECHGDGAPRIVYRDSRYLSEGARLLYMGARYDAKGGIEVKLRDHVWAEEMLAKHLGLIATSKEQQLPARQASERLVELTDEELEREIMEVAGSMLIEHVPIPLDQAIDVASIDEGEE